MWMIKALVQAILSLVPMGETINYWLQSVNPANPPGYTRERVIRLSRKMAMIDRLLPLDGVTAVDIGTGWNLINCIMLYIMGVKSIHTYDHVRHVRMSQAQDVLQAVEEEIETVADITLKPIGVLRERLERLKGLNCLEEVLNAAGINYHAPADATETGLDDNSVDLVYSYAVLEHVPKEMISDLLEESKRILTDRGLSYHRIEYHDHYVTFDKKISKVNYLKYPNWLWALLAQNRISYQNRLRHKQYLEMFEASGARIEVAEPQLDEQDVERVKTMRLDEQFQHMTPEELAIYVADIIISFPDEERELSTAGQGV